MLRDLPSKGAEEARTCPFRYSSKLIPIGMLATSINRLSRPNASATRSSVTVARLCLRNILLALTNVCIAVRRDAQFLLDVGHHRVLQACLAEFRIILGDNALP
jgi:hypothetical protein